MTVTFFKKNLIKLLFVDQSEESALPVWYITGRSRLIRSHSSASISFEIGGNMN